MKINEGKLKKVNFTKKRKKTPPSKNLNKPLVLWFAYCQKKKR